MLYSRTPDNIGRLVAALVPLQPYLRGAPPGLPFTWDAETISRGLNFTLTTTAGDLDLLGEVTYGGTDGRLLTDTEIVSAFGIECRCLTLETSPLARVSSTRGRSRCGRRGSRRS